jgi:mannose-6-phosphate isomerase-like protein (cupin superfamily)
MLSSIRRIVTGHDAAGKSVVIMDQTDPHKRAIPDSGIVLHDMWIQDGTPADVSLDTDAVVEREHFAPPDHGNTFFLVDFPPYKPQKAGYVQDMVGTPEAVTAKPARHPMVHRTRTLDYALVLSGEIDLLLDETQVHVKAGDIVIQQGTVHGWVNSGTEPCRIAFVMIDAKAPPAWVNGR